MHKPTVAEITADLVAEQQSLDVIVAPLSPQEWERPTPSVRWAVRDQIGHLAFFDASAVLAITDPAAFGTHRELLAAAFDSPEGIDQFTLGKSRTLHSDQLIVHWRNARAELATAAATCSENTRIRWYGPSMGARSFLTARLMECWAHGQDICDALAIAREPTDRLRHIAQLGVATRRWTYANRCLEVPPGEVRVDLVAPSGVAWSWGPEDTDEKIAGSAIDFCLVTAQRRNVADTELLVEGPAALDWLSLTQMFAGPPTDPPSPHVTSRRHSP